MIKTKWVHAPVTNGQDLLHGVEGNGRGLEGEPVQTGLFQLEVVGDQRLDNLRLQPSGHACIRQNVAQEFL